MQTTDQLVEGYENAKKQNQSPSEYLQEHITPMIQTGMTSELYSLSHKLIRLFPDDENCWFCIGCYYWVVNKLDLAQKFIRRALKKNKTFAMAWILLGHIFSANEESEQALSSYRTAVRLLPNHKLPLICLSKELLHSGNYWLAGHMLQSARSLDPSDILVLNEMALIAVKLGNLNQAEGILRKAISSIDIHKTNSIAFSEVSEDDKPPPFPLTLTRLIYLFIYFSPSPSLCL
jgi:tetratricopeptide (TPR) repeat protein